MTKTVFFQSSLLFCCGLITCANWSNNLDFRFCRNEQLIWIIDNSRSVTIGIYAVLYSMSTLINSNMDDIRVFRVLICSIKWSCDNDYHRSSINLNLFKIKLISYIPYYINIMINSFPSDIQLLPSIGLTLTHLQCVDISHRNVFHWFAQP